MSTLRQAAKSVIEQWDGPVWEVGDIAQIDAVYSALRTALAAPEPYDQQALELCGECGWKAIMPGTPCFVCNLEAEAQQVAVPLSDEQIESACRFIEPSFDGPIAYDLLIARAIERAHGIGAKP